MDKWLTNISILNDKHQESSMLFTYGEVIFLMWFKILFLLKISPLLGPMIRTMSKMVQDMCVFALMYIMIILVFATFGQIFFTDIYEFKTYSHAYLYLFNSSLANYEFDIFDESIH